MGFNITQYSSLSNSSTAEAWANFYADKLYMSVYEVDSDTYILYKGTYNGNGIKVYKGTVSSSSNVVGLALVVNGTTQYPSPSGTTYSGSSLGSGIVRRLDNISYPMYIYEWDDNSSSGDFSIIMQSSSTMFSSYQPYLNVFWTKEQHSDGSVGYIYGFTADGSYWMYLVNDTGYVLGINTYTTTYWVDSGSSSEVWLTNILVGDISSSRLFFPLKFPSVSRTSVFEDEDGHKYLSMHSSNGSNMKFILQLT